MSSFKFFTTKDWLNNSCVDKKSKVISKDEDGRIETWDYIGMTNNEDWDLDLDIFDIVANKSKKYVILRPEGKSMDEAVILKTNGEIKRGGYRFRFRCPSSFQLSNSRRSPKRCPKGLALRECVKVKS